VVLNPTAGSSAAGAIRLGGREPTVAAVFNRHALLKKSHLRFMLAMVTDQTV
jgi:hypothetical protein